MLKLSYGLKVAEPQNAVEELRLGLEFDLANLEVTLDPDNPCFILCTCCIIQVI